MLAWYDTIKMKVVDWIYLTECRDTWWANVKRKGS
jgi:hypothetical protein